jgi:hypothetical protein
VTRPHLDTLIEVWQRAREIPSFGNDIAQQAALLTLTRRDKSVREAAYFLQTCHYLRLHHYSDGTGEQRNDRLSYRREVQAREDDALHVGPMDYSTPEAIIMAKETLHELGPALDTALNTKYTPLTDPTTCKRGHKGQIHFITRRNGTPQRACRLCNSMRQGRYRQQKKANKM